MAKPKPVTQGDHKPPSQRDYNATLRMKQVAELRLQGLEFAEIAERCGYKDHSGAWRAWKHYLSKLPVVETKEARSDAERRLNVALAAIWEKVKKGDMWAIDRMLALEKRRAELMGLDMVATGGLPEGITREYVGVNITEIGPGQTLSANGRSKEPLHN